MALPLLGANLAMQAGSQILQGIGGIVSGIAGRVNSLIKENKIVEADSRKCLISNKTIKPVKALRF